MSHSRASILKFLISLSNFIYFQFLPLVKSNPLTYSKMISKWTECPDINQTHILPNITALQSLTKEELNSLNSALLNFGQVDSSSCIKSHFRPVWPLYILLYSSVAFFGAIGNIYMIITIISETSCKRFINFLLFNLCLSDLFKSIIVIPLSLIVLSLSHWRLGSWLCHAAPLLQTLPMVVTMLTYVLVACERYFLVFRPSTQWRKSGTSGRILYMVIVCGVWVSSICLILPLKASVRYYDLASYFGRSVDGYGFCAISFDTNTKEINCALFVVLFAIPLAFITYVMTKTNQELNLRLRVEDQYAAPPAQSSYQNQQLHPSASRLLPAPTAYAAVANDHRRSSRPRSASENVSLNSRSPSINTPNRGTDNRDRRSFLSYIDHERTQLTLLLSVNRCMCTMLAFFALCWTPLECVMLICYIIPETPDTSATVDALFVAFTRMGFLSTVANPALLIHQKRSVQVVLNTGIRLLRRLSSGDRGRRAEADLRTNLLIEDHY